MHLLSAAVMLAGRHVRAILLSWPALILMLLVGAMLWQGIRVLPEHIVCSQESLEPPDVNAEHRMCII